MARMKPLLVMVLVALMLPLARDSHAQESRTVRAREAVVLVTSPEPVRITAAPTRGAAAVHESQTPRAFLLTYSAPDTSAVFTEHVRFTVGTNERTMTITVTPADNDRIYAEAFKALFIVFVIALLLESGLSTLFNWRPFVVYFDGRGMKTVVSVVAAYLFVNGFRLDIVTQLVNVYSQRTPPYDPSVEGRFVTALVIAGGSAMVNNLLVALGFRSVRTAADVAPKPPKTEGWISVGLDRIRAVGPVDVLVGDPALGPPVAGTIVGGRRRSALTRLFLRDQSRFPQSGGFAVAAGSNCAVVLKGLDSQGVPISASWGPNTIAAGGIVDLVIKL